jgi:transaldolase
MMAAIGRDEATFRQTLDHDAMAAEKRSKGIRRFTRDTETLSDLIRTPGAALS